MMTLRYVNVDGRDEVIPVASAIFDPDTKVLIGRGTPDGERQWTHGRAFLMNDHGKTVATYILKQKEQS